MDCVKGVGELGGGTTVPASNPVLRYVISMSYRLDGGYRAAWTLGRLGWLDGGYGSWM